MFEARPLWGTGAFALAVFGGAIGAVLLLIRKSIAIYVLAASLIGTIAAQVPMLGMVGVTAAAWGGWLSQVIVGAFLLWYAKRAKNNGWIG